MKLNRQNFNAPLAPERMVHIGIGAFAKAHQLWYTQQVDVNNEWGVVAFTGRSATIADQLTEQDGLYTLVERGAQGDKFEVMSRIVRSVDGNNINELEATIANPNIAVVTLTITEAGYGTTNNPTVVITRIANALNARHMSNGKPIALVPCDNIPNNGEFLRSVINNVFANFDEKAKSWLQQNVSFVSTSIDRITPKTTNSDIELVKTATGWEDNSVTVTEPFKDWILCGEFPAGRPQWENAGANFVTDIEIFERRKLWLLNGSHSLLAYAGIARGHQTVAEAIVDSECRARVEELWDAAARHLPQAELQIDSYRKALIERFENPRIAHQLRQIAIDGATKLAVRIAPGAKAELAAGRDAGAAAFTIAVWAEFLAKGEFIDSREQDIRTALENQDSKRALIRLLDPDLAKDDQFVGLVKSFNI